MSERSDPDVVVIGGGIVGLFCAYYLRRAGHSVTLVEQGDIGGPQSCSSGNTGFVGTHGAAPLAEPGLVGWRLLRPDNPLHVRLRWDPALARWLWQLRRAATPDQVATAFRVLVDLKQRSLAIIREVARAGPLADTVTANGMVLAFRTDAGFARGRASVPRAMAHGVPLRELTPDELSTLEPGVRFAIRGALFNDEGTTLRVPDFLVEFGRKLERMGVTIRANTGVTGFKVSSGSVSAVRTADGELTPTVVVLAAGAQSAGLAHRLGVSLALQPVTGHSVTVAAPANAPSRPIILAEGRVAVLPLGDTLRVGGTMELAGLSSRPSERRIALLGHTVRTFLPELVATPVGAAWTGERPCTPDSLPFVGRLPSPDNVWLACGGGHIGLGLAPVSGRLIAQLIDGEEPEVDLTPLRVARFGQPPVPHA